MKDEEVLRLLAEGERDMKWAQENRAVLEEKYPEEYVAVKEEKVVGHGADLEALISALEERGIDPALTCIEYMDTSDVVQFL